MKRAASYPRFAPGEEAIIAGSFEVVDVVAQSGRSVLVKRAGFQTTYDARDLEPWSPDFCPLEG